MNQQNNGRTFTNKVKTFTNKVSNVASNTSQKLQNAYNKVANNTTRQFRKSANAIKGAVSDETSIFGKISTQTLPLRNATREFIAANTTIAKVVFIIVLMIIFSLLLRVGLYLLDLVLRPSKNPIIVNGIRSTKEEEVYQVNPNLSNPKPVLRSINEDQGMEFTWSTWFWVKEVGDISSSAQPLKIFSKGKTIKESNVDGSWNIVPDAPGVYIYNSSFGDNTNTIAIYMATYDNHGNSKSNTREIIYVENIPMQKWVNLIIRVQHNTIDIFINGVLTKRVNLSRVPKQNYGDVYVGDNTYGMNGYISSLRYFNHGIGQNKIQEIMYLGPNMKMIGDELNESQPPYLSTQWYLNH